MKIFALASLALPLLVLASPVAEPESELKPAPIDKRAVTCTLSGSDVRYRQGPSTATPADGQYGAAGTRVSFSCYVVGQSVGGNTKWYYVASGKGAGDYVSDVYVKKPCNAPRCND